MDLVVDALFFVTDSALDVLPIVLFLFAFQWFVIGKRMPNGGKIIVGFVFVVVGLGLFLEGLEHSLFPLGRMMAEQLTHPEFLLDTVEHAVAEFTWQDFYWVYIFAAAVGFSTAMAEPSLMAVAMKANTVSGGAIGVVGLRVAVAIGAGIGVSLAASASSRDCRCLISSRPGTSLSSCKRWQPRERSCRLHTTREG